MILGPHRPRAGRSLNEGRAKGSASQGAFSDPLWKDYPQQPDNTATMRGIGEPSDHAALVSTLTNAANTDYPRSSACST